MCLVITCKVLVNPVSHPNSNEYSAFVQDTIRVTGRLAVSLGLRYDMQTFNSKDLVNQSALAGVRKNAAR